MPPSEWNILDFEKPIAELDQQINEIKRITIERGEDRSADIAALERDRDRLLEEIFANLTPWDRTLLARHPKRPYTLDYVRIILTTTPSFMAISCSLMTMLWLAA